MVREGELISVRDHRAVLARVMDAFRAASLCVPGSSGPRIVGITSPAEGSETMRVCSEELLRDMVKWADELEADRNSHIRLLR